MIMNSTGQSVRSTHNFDAIAGDAYDESIPLHIMQHLTRRRLNVIHSIADHGRILDVGCGTGRILQSLSEPAYERYGVDVSIGMLAQAQRKDAGIMPSLASATDLPFPDNSFDVVFCAAVLHHVAEESAVAKAIREIVRVTKVGGGAIIWDHNPLNPYWPILMSRVPQDIGEERLISRREIASTLQRLQATNTLNVEWRQMTFIPDFAPQWSLPILAVAEAFFEYLPLVKRISAHNIAIVRKRA